MNRTPPVSRGRSLLIPTLFVLVATACAAAPRPGAHGRDAGTLVVHVVNRGWSDVVVYLAQGNVPLRLGRVAGLDRTRLRVASPGTGDGVRLLVRAVDSDQVYSADPVLTGDGGIVELTVQPMLLASDVTVLSYGALAR